MTGSIPLIVPMAVRSQASETRLNEAAFADFYQRTERPLWAYVYRVSGNAADADDIVSESFCRLLQSIDATLREEAQRAYLFRIAGNLLTDRWRKSVRERNQPPLPEPQPSSDAQVDEDVTRTFSRLKRRDRALLWLAYVEERNHEEIAASLSLRRGSVKVMLSRARRRLRDLLRAAGLSRG